MPPNHRSVYWLWVTVMAGSLLVACKKEEKPQQSAKPKPITQVIGVARIEPEQGLIDVFAGATGRIKTLPISENQTVNKGQVMLTIDSEADNEQITQARSKIGTQRAAIAAQQAGVVTLKLSADKAQADYELNQKLFDVKGVTKQTLHDSEVNTAKLRQEYKKGLADLEQTRAKITEMNADVAYYTILAQQKIVRSPYAGKLLEWTVNAGDYVTGSTKVAQMAPVGNLIARTEVDELFAERIQPGQKADIRSQATGTIIGQGTVYFAADYLKKKSLFEDETAQEDRRVREVRIRLGPSSNLLINGRVDCIIHLH